MGAFNSRMKEQMNTPPARPCSLKRIEDPRSPTEEISRTPIEVNEKFIRENDTLSCQRTNALKEQNQYSSVDFSPRIRKTDWLAKDFKKIKSNFATAFENETVSTSDVDQTTLIDKEVSEKENLS